MIVVDFFVPWHVCLPFECSFQRALKFEGPLEINTNLSRAKRLFEGQIVGPESIAIDSTGTCKNTLTSGLGEMGGRGRDGDDVTYTPGENSMRCAGCIHSETLTLFPISDQNNHVIFLSLFQTWNYCCSHDNYRWFWKKVSSRLISRRKKPCKEIPRGKKFLHWLKNLSWGIILEKKSCKVVCQGKNSISRGLEEKILT